MTQRDISEINWRAVFVGFGVDWAFSLPLGLLVSVIMMALKGVSLEAEVWPADVLLASQIVGGGGAGPGGIAAGYLARRRGSLHGLLASLLGLFASLCWFGVALSLGDLGFIVLNLVGAGYGGSIGERWRARRERGDREDG
jgi:hypothetical protein